MFSPILLSTLKLKDKYGVTGPYYMQCPNPTEPAILALSVPPNPNYQSNGIKDGNKCVKFGSQTTNPGTVS